MIFSFLRMAGKTKAGESFTKTRKMQAEDFSKLLNNCYVAQVPKEGFRHPMLKDDDDDEWITGSDLLKKLPEEEITQIVAPLKLLNEDGSKAKFDESLVASVSCGNLKDRDGEPIKFHFEMRVRYPECRFGGKTKQLDYDYILTTPHGDASDYLQKGYGLFTDAGRSEGYGLRQFLTNILL